jgi:hypothetical protein
MKKAAMAIRKPAKSELAEKIIRALSYCSDTVPEWEHLGHLIPSRDAYRIIRRVIREHEGK